MSSPVRVLTEYIGKHAYFQGMFNLQELDNEADYAIFDDLIGDLESFKQYKQWFGCKQEFTTTDKYARKRKIIWGKPSIWLSNNDPRASPHIDLDWWDKNVITCNITKPIARVTQPSDQ